MTVNTPGWFRKTHCVIPELRQLTFAWVQFQAAGALCTGLCPYCRHNKNSRASSLWWTAVLGCWFGRRIAVRRFAYIASIAWYIGRVALCATLVSAVVGGRGSDFQMRRLLLNEKLQTNGPRLLRA